MKNKLKISVLLLGLAANAAWAKDIPQSKVPSVIVNNFQQNFPKASGIEWEQDGQLFKVEFEIGMFGTDHDAWYDQTGKLVKHKEEINKTDLPAKVQASLSKNFANFKTEEAQKMTENEKVTYVVEVEKKSEEWKVSFDADGNIIAKIAD
ncbi:Putative beta-lactamase-inhibitor-like, PepSY-like [Flexibacter flexilis DSM 6793]|uniref:Putative beta-lactamase-inhibitor-like, PepSY-like n=1 Tax=Flexibacter flexilis DSM 6793 TaxID=927664 RepID=A0A1I1DEL1_9BACT|nr:PepSY-like domain-containing protein [Flexibacter flexilis]SFB73395.1 Putative beta-lactamase-inhibitor-like, PepSY-like [Flexibacter flexilis DSM 6793]